MKTCLAFVLATLISASLSPLVAAQGGFAPVDQAPEPLYGAVHALCIGISDYDSTLISDLDHAETDAQRVASVLAGVYGAEVQSLLGEEATLDAIRAALDGYRATLTGDDAFLVYFAGHGAEVFSDPSGARRSGFLIPQDAPLDLEDRLDPDEWRRQAIEMPALVGELGELPARQVLLIADACHSGYLGRVPRGGAALTDDLFELIGRRSCAVITAGTEGQQAFEDSELAGGIFTHYLLAELEKARAQSALELFLAVRRGVQSGTNRAMLPLFREMSSEHGEFVFVPRDAASPSEAVAAAAKRRLRARGQSVEMTDVFRAFEAFDYRHGADAEAAGRVWLADVKRFEQSAALADPLALLCLHLAYEKGLGVEPDPAKALRLARLALDTGHAAGDLAMYQCYHLAVGVEGNELTAAPYLERAQAARFPPAVLYQRTREIFGGSPVDRDALEDDLEWLFELGSNQARLRLAQCYSGLAGFPADFPKAVSLLLPAAESGDPYAAQSLFAIYIQGRPGVPQEPGRALEYLESAARAGLATAQYDLAQLLHQEGAYGGMKGLVPGLEPDLQRARILAELAAKQGNAKALVMLARMHVYGQGVEKDYRRAAEYCEEAIRGNDVEAMVEKGTWLLDGLVLPRDEKAAYTLFLQASERGDREGHYWRAHCLENVRGVEYAGDATRREMRPHFLVHAMNWYVQAAEMGHSEARRLLGEPRFRATLGELRAAYPEAAAAYERMLGR